MTGWDHRWFWYVLIDLVFVANLRLVKWILPCLNIVWIICSAQKKSARCLKGTFWNIFFRHITFMYLELLRLFVGAFFFRFNCGQAPVVFWYQMWFTEVCDFQKYRSFWLGITYWYQSERYNASGRSFTHDFLEASCIYKSVLEL